MELPEKHFPPNLLAIIKRLKKHGQEAYVVGGSLRALLMERPVTDWDLATSALPEEVMSIFSHALPTGIKHGTVTVVSEGTHFEITTFRIEADYGDARHPDEVTFIRSIEEDLKRRDFTINAMAYDPSEKRLIDLFNGRDDLRRGIIRAVGDPRARFAEDGLRPYRAARFASQLDFVIEEKTFRAISDCLEAARRVSMERIRDEFNKILLSPVPSKGLELLRTSGLLALFCPELAACVEVEQNKFHPDDVYRHALKSCDHSPPDLAVRLASLFHDLGKTPARQFDPDKEDYTFYGHEKIGAEMAGQIMERMKYSKALSRQVVSLVRHHMFHYTPEWKDAAVRRFMRSVGVDNLGALFLLREADSKAQRREAEDGERLDELRERVQAVQREGQALRVTDLAVDGKDVMAVLNLPPGEPVGAVLHALLEEVLEDPAVNTREKLLELLKKRR